MALHGAKLAPPFASLAGAPSALPVGQSSSRWPQMAPGQDPDTTSPPTSSLEEVPERPPNVVHEHALEGREASQKKRPSPHAHPLPKAQLPKAPNAQDCTSQSERRLGVQTKTAEAPSKATRSGSDAQGRSNAEITFAEESRPFLAWVGTRCTRRPPRNPHHLGFRV